jgi:hypothetical protein
LYVLAFWGCKKLFVWHDVPSLKTVANAKLNKNRLYCAILQKLVLKRSDFNVTFSFHDSKFLSFFHGYNSAVMPVILRKASLQKRVQIKQSWLLTGNWHRAENCEGARIFLIECFNLLSNFKSNVKPALAFNFAGYGADLFINNLLLVLNLLDLSPNG